MSHEPEQLSLSETFNHAASDSPEHATDEGHGRTAGSAPSPLEEYDRDEWRKMLEEQRDNPNAEMHHRPDDPELVSEMRKQSAQDLEIEISRHNPDNDPIIDEGFDLDF